MMHDFLTAHRGELIERCRAKVAHRSAPEPTPDELRHGIPMFLDQLVKTLRVEQTSEPMESRKVSGPASGLPSFSEIGEGATIHGRELYERGFTVEQVVHDYGDLCQAITDLAFERQAPFGVDEFRTLNRCLDNAIAGAVSAFVHQRDYVAAENEAKILNRRLGFFAHELRNQLSSAMLALKVIKDGNLTLAGATGAVLDRSLVNLQGLIDRSLAEVRHVAGVPAHPRLFSVADFVAEVKLSASLEADVRKCVLHIAVVDPTLAVEADRDLLLSAVGNLLQNAFKYTRHGTEVRLHAYAAADRVLIEVEDHCGGLPVGAVETIFLPFTQASADRTGLGLGLAISQRGVEANQGSLRVRDVPGTGCIFTIDLPRRTLPSPFSALAS